MKSQAKFKNFESQPQHIGAQVNSKSLGSLYHVTAKKNLKSIMQHGLVSNIFGYIFLYMHNTRINMADILAYNQVFVIDLMMQKMDPTEEYIVIQIDCEGINGKLNKQTVGEFISPGQLILKQEIIEPQYLKLHETRRMDLNGIARDQQYLTEVYQECGSTAPVFA